MPDLIVDTSTGKIRQQEYYPLSNSDLWPLVRHRYRLVATFEGIRMYRLDHAR